MSDSVGRAGQAGNCDDSTTAVVQFPLVQSASGVEDVERINPFDFYELSQTLKTLAQKVGDHEARSCFFDLMQASSALSELAKGRPIQLGVSKACALALEDCVDRLIDTHLFENDPDKPGETRFREKATPILSWEWENYRRLLTTFETVFNEEMRETAAYYVPRRGIYWTPALVDTAEESFPPQIRVYLPEKTVVDWRAAGRCLAFNLLSASGFHVARAVEGTMESYYQLFSGKAGTTLRSWDDYAKALEKIAEGSPTPCPNAKTLTEFRQMKDDYRNPIVHPRVVLTEPDARMLFANGESLIIAMAQEIGEASIGVQPRLIAETPIGDAPGNKGHP